MESAYSFVKQFFSTVLRVTIYLQVDVLKDPEEVLRGYTSYVVRWHRDNPYTFKRDVIFGPHGDRIVVDDIEVTEDEF